MTDILHTVTDRQRGDERFLVRDMRNSDYFLLNTQDDCLSVKFEPDTISIYIADGEEWVDFFKEPGMEVAITLEPDGVLDIPRWVFEELYCIYENGELRPTNEYNKRFESTPTPTPADS